MKRNLPMRRWAKQIAKELMTVDCGSGRKGIWCNRIAMMKKHGTKEIDEGGRCRRSVEQVIEENLNRIFVEFVRDLLK